jgi:RHS repeat-associated protein
VVNTSDGSVAQSMTHDEFGRVLTDTAPGFQPFAFAGGLYDRDTGLVRFGARDYDPQIGRFVSKDPIGFSGGSANLYTYSFNDPVNFADPSGMLTIPFVGWVDLGETAGSAALEQWADHLTDPNTTGIDLIGGYIGGFFAALWTPCTSDKTAATLTAAYGANAYVGRSFYQYYPANNAAYNSRYLTRGPGWKPPYSTGTQAAEKLSLPPWNPGTAVRQVPNRWDQFVGGPGKVGPKFGHNGGGTEYLVGGSPK